jgi:DnaJ-class molecular chaperone
MSELTEPCEKCNGQGWFEDCDSGHGCDGTEADCVRNCPIPIQIQVECEWCFGTGIYPPNDRP